jgi:tRNA threonylcarbamoyladenosine biosynthesis protein TsaE
MEKIISKSAAGTRRAARRLLQKILAYPAENAAAVIALEGEFGAGKTILTQFLSRALGVRENVLSPTFVLLKEYPIRKGRFRRFVHIDCYRISSPADILRLEFRGILKDPAAIVVIEWAEKIKDILPRASFRAVLAHGRDRRERHIRFFFPRRKPSFERRGPKVLKR